MIKTIITAIGVCTIAASSPAHSQSTASVGAGSKARAMTQTGQRKETPASLRRQARISMKTARATGLREVPKGKIQSGELERENGKLIYSFDIKVAGKSGIEEIAIDAVTGAMLDHKHETPADEMREAAAAKKEKK